MARKRIFSSVILIAVAVSLCGCFSAKKEDLNAYLKPDQADVTMQEYIIQPPDKVTIIASGIPELAGQGNQVGQVHEVRPDGMISYEKLGEIPVAGKTPRQVAELIAQRLSGLYKINDASAIDVRVTNLSKYYYVLGQVRMPGAKIFTGRETTLSALAKAIPGDLAWKEQIQVIRPSKIEGQPAKIFRLDYRAMVIHGKNEHNVLLEEGDIIYVPPTVFGAIGLTVGEILSPILQGGRAVQVFSGTP